METSPIVVKGCKFWPMLGTHFRAFSNGAVTTCYLLRLGFAPPTFRLRCQRSNPLRHRRSIATRYMYIKNETYVNANHPPSLFRIFQKCTVWSHIPVRSYYFVNGLIVIKLCWNEYTFIWNDIKTWYQKFIHPSHPPSRLPDLEKRDSMAVWK